MDIDIFKNGWNSENAYIFGWIMSDGCLMKCGRNKTTYAVVIVSNDYDVIEWLHQKLCIGNKIYKCGNGYSIKYRNISSINFMISNNLKERKSLTMEFPSSIPEEFVFDFLRGYFDGDGSLILHKTDYNTYGQVSFTCGSVQFVNTIREILAVRGIDSHVYQDGRCGNSSYYLKVTKRSEIIKLFNLMYSGDKYCLKRKYNKFCSLFDAKPKYNIAPLDNIFSYDIV